MPRSRLVSAHQFRGTSAREPFAQPGAQVIPTLPAPRRGGLGRIAVSPTVKLRYLIWRIRVPAVICAIMLAWCWPRSAESSVAEHQLPVAANDIARGSAVSPKDLLFPPGSTTQPADSPIVGQIALVPITQGGVLTEAMFAPSIQTGLAPEGTVLTVVTLANPDILKYVQTGTTLDIFGATQESSERIVTGGEVMFGNVPSVAGENQETWAVKPYGTNSEQDSSTVLLAVTPKEAAALARIPLWENSLVAAIVK